MAAAPIVQRGVCIVNSEAENAVDAAAIRRLGFKLRMSPSCLPSLLITGRGGTFAFVLLDEKRDNETWERCLACSSTGQLHATCDHHVLLGPVTAIMQACTACPNTQLLLIGRQRAMWTLLLPCRIDRVHSKGFPNAFVIVCGHPSGLSCAGDALLQAISR